MPRERQAVKLSLFDPKSYDAPQLKNIEEYTTAINHLWRNDDPRFDERDADIFDDVSRSEVFLTETKTTIYGALTATLDKRALDFKRRAITLTGWIESDRLQFRKCRTKGILLIEKATHFNRLVPSKAWRELDLLLITGNGIPRVSTRRILHRLQKQFKLPVYVLADNDTWGYFIFSVLKRGALPPHIMYPQLAVKDVRYLGLRAGDFAKECDHLLLPWKKHWVARLRPMERYPCFKSAAWKAEFRAFRFQRGKIELDAMPYILGEGSRRTRMSEYVRRLIVERIRRKQWLS